MPIINSRKALAEIRKRKDQHKQLQLEARYERRYVAGKHVPKQKTRRQLSKITPLHQDDYLCTHLENQPMYVYAKRSHLLYLLETGDIKDAQTLLDDFACLNGFDSGINLQFVLTQKAQIMLITNQPQEKVIPLIYQALKITWEEFSEHSLGNNSLLYEEPRLLHALAATRARMGNFSTAISLLKHGVNDLLSHHPDDLGYSNLLACMLHDLAKYQLQTKEYILTVETCDFGIHTSIMRRHGKYVPDFHYIKAYAYKELSDHKMCKQMLQLAYFGQMLLQKVTEAQEILTSAQKNFGITFDTYFVDKLDFTPYTKTEYKLGELHNFKSLNEMVGTLRTQLGLTVRQLAEGLCPPSTLNKFENKQIEETQLYYLEPILQRLGRGIDPYCNVFLSARAYNARKMREEINQLLSSKQFDKAEDKLNTLENEKDYQKYANRQFILMAKAMLYLGRYGFDEKYYKKVMEALNVTWKNFDENAIYKRALTRYEATLINQLGNYYMATKDLERAEKIFSQLFKQQNTQYVDESQKALLFGTVAYNYSGCLNDEERWKKALEVIKQGEEFACSHDRLPVLPLLNLNKAFAMYNKGEKKESIPYFALSYYGFVMLAEHGETENMTIARNLAKEYFDINFDY